MPAVAVRLAIRIGMRLVALASIACSPSRIGTGGETAEPDEATTLRKPQPSPASAATR